VINGLATRRKLISPLSGQVVTVKTLSGAIYNGRVTEVTNDFVELVEKKEAESAQVFFFFTP